MRCCWPGPSLPKAETSYLEARRKAAASKAELNAFYQLHEEMGDFVEQLRTLAPGGVFSLSQLAIRWRGPLIGCQSRPARGKLGKAKLMKRRNNRDGPDTRYIENLTYGQPKVEGGGGGPPHSRLRPRNDRLRNNSIYCFRLSGEIDGIVPPSRWRLEYSWGAAAYRISVLVNIAVSLLYALCQVNNKNSQTHELPVWVRCDFEGRVNRRERLFDSGGSLYRVGADTRKPKERWVVRPQKGREDSGFETVPGEEYSGVGGGFPPGRRAGTGWAGEAPGRRVQEGFGFSFYGTSVWFRF